MNMEKVAFIKYFKCGVLFLFIVLVAPNVSLYAQSTMSLVNAFYLRSLPIKYDDIERMFAQLKNTGANTIILKLPTNTDESFNFDALPDAVYLAHRYEFKIFVVIPVRTHPAVLAHNPIWEDYRYDPATGTIVPSGKLDLFNSAAVEYVASLCKEVASYSVDGILLDVDFAYYDMEGMSRTAIALTEERFAASFRISKLFQKIIKDEHRYNVVKFGELFWKWAELKRDCLVNTYEQIRKAARSVNSRILVGVPAPVLAPVALPADALARYAFDMTSFRRVGVDIYWADLDYRNIKDKTNITLRRSLESLSRDAQSVMTIIKDIDKLTIVLPAVGGTGKTLPLSEIEEATEIIRRIGTTGIAYRIDPDGIPSFELMRKLFTTQAPNSAL